MKNDEELVPSDYELPKDELLVLNDLLEGKCKCNILFYGQPGTGKTSLAKTLAKTYKKTLLSVKVPQNDEHKDRLLAINATINLADKDHSIILIDEADEILNTYNFWSHSNTTNKSWINNLLDSHDKKIIWITNHTEGIDPSTLRRFSFAREFKELSVKDRMKVLLYVLKKKGLDDLFTREELSDICEDYSVDAGGIVNAIKICKASRKGGKDTLLKKVKAVLKNHEKITSGSRADRTIKKKYDNYTITGLNTSHDLDEIIRYAKRYLEANDKSRPMSLLLYGAPGTGKTEFVHYLGHRLDKKVSLKRCSEIQSMYVGETEKNIAKAFREASEDERILFFDEADSFLYPRRSAVRSFEISFTNEILAQLDSFSGIVIFATNDIDGLDHAALRRFKFKIEFKPLTPVGNLHFYNMLLRSVVIDRTTLSEDEIRQIKNIPNLTPGDFVVVKEQFAFETQSAISHQQLIEALKGEARHKKEAPCISGFKKL